MDGRFRPTADKIEIKDSPKLFSATSFVSNPLGDIMLSGCSTSLLEFVE